MDKLQGFLQSKLNGLLAYLVPVAGKPAHDGTTLVQQTKAEPDGAYGFLSVTTPWSGDPADRDSYLRLAIIGATLGHFKYGLFGYRTPLLQRLC